MKKNKLIELLQNIKGNPEIKLWNGFVGDWMNFKLEEGFTLVKECESFIREGITFQWMRDNNTRDITEDGQKWIDAAVARRLKWEEWDLPNKYVPQEDFNRWYGTKRKTAVFIDAKPRGKKTFDRLGDIAY